MRSEDEEREVEDEGTSEIEKGRKVENDLGNKTDTEEKIGESRDTQ